MMCYDAYFGKVFEADFNNVKEKTKSFNEQVKTKSYVFAREYLKYLEDMADDKESIMTYCVSDYLLDNYGFQPRNDDLIILEFGLLDGEEVLIIRPWAY